MTGKNRRGLDVFQGWGDTLSVSEFSSPGEGEIAAIEGRFGVNGLKELIPRMRRRDGLSPEEFSTVLTQDDRFGIWGKAGQMRPAESEPTELSER